MITFIEIILFSENRPPFIILDTFIKKYKDWLIPTYLGQGSSDQITTYLIGKYNFLV